MRKYNKMTENDVKDLYVCFDEGLRNREITELTGRCSSVINRYRKQWKKDRAKKPAESESETTPSQTTVEPEPAESDYAKRYMADDPAVVHSAFEIRQTIEIRSKKTGVLYSIDPEQGDKLTIDIPGGNLISMTLKDFDKFVDEGVDVVLEIKRRLKK